MKALTTHFWYRKTLFHPLTLLLLPFSWMFACATALRRWCYRVGILKQYRLNMPVIVIGNISVGGTGKTPLVIWLAAYLQSKGLRPGIISRGYGGRKHRKPFWVDKNDMVEQVGDEALLLARNTDCPLVLCIDRVAALSALIAETKCDVVISDDGLQHYRLARDIEIVVVDGLRQLGNRCLLPAGPLREPPTRLDTVDYVMINAAQMNSHCNLSNDTLRPSPQMTIKPIDWVSVKDSRIHLPLTLFKHKRVHAIAAIGNPVRFFATLRQIGLEVIEHAFPDHYFFTAKDLYFHDDLPIVMTEKDAVKCALLAHDHWWYLRVQVEVDNDLQEELYSNICSKFKVSSRVNARDPIKLLKGAK